MYQNDGSNFSAVCLMTMSSCFASSLVLSIPDSNAFCERVFSNMNQLGLDSRNLLSTELVKSELMVKINFCI